MDVYIEPAPWPDRARDPHLLVAAGLASFSAYLLFVLVLAIVEPATTPAATPDQGRRVPVRIETRVEAEPAEPVAEVPEVKQAAKRDGAEAPPEIALTPQPAAAPAPRQETPETDVPAPETGTAGFSGTIDLSLPAQEPMRTLPPVCRAGPCAPGTVTLPRIRPERRPAHEVLADLDPEVLKNLDLDALGIDSDLADVFGEREVRLSRDCDLVQRADNVVTRQMTSPQYLRCRRSTVSKARAQALLDALREKRPDLFDDR